MSGAPSPNKNIDSEGRLGRPLPVVIAGHVDHGKSTLIGRLLHDIGALPPERIEALRSASRRRGTELEWSFLLDALQAERDQNVTIDTSRARFVAGGREYVLIDAPGHKEFLKNMVTGAAAARAALLVVDAEEGPAEQTRRHALLLRLLGIQRIVVLVNKIDRILYSEEGFARVRSAIVAALAALEIAPHAVIPVSARHGDNVVARSDRMGWYAGPTLAEALAALPDQPARDEAPLRLPVQDVYRVGDRRIVVGRIESGRLRVGDTLRFQPGERVGRVRAIEAWNGPAPLVAGAGQSVGLTLEDEVFVERGMVASVADTAPAAAASLRVRLFWLSPRPLTAGERLAIRIGNAEYPVVVASVERVLALNDDVARQVFQRGDIGEAVLESRQPVIVDDAATGGHLGRGVLVRDSEIAGGFVVEAAQPFAAPAALPRNVTPMRSRVTAQQRAAAYGHAGAILWLTGLPGSGKSTLAGALEERLIATGFRVIVLDGDTVRSTVNTDLGFSGSDRSENIRRIGEMARILAEAGLVVVVSCISPFRADRDRLRAASGPLFHEVFVKADVATCESRDPKGLYARARRGEIRDFTGVSSPCEAPPQPELEIATDELDVAAAVERLAAYCERFRSDAAPGLLVAS